MMGLQSTTLTLDYWKFTSFSSPWTEICKILRDEFDANFEFSHESQTIQIIFKSQEDLLMFTLKYGHLII